MSVVPEFRVGILKGVKVAFFFNLMFLIFALFKIHSSSVLSIFALKLQAKNEHKSKLKRLIYTAFIIGWFLNKKEVHEYIRCVIVICSVRNYIILFIFICLDLHVVVRYNKIRIVKFDFIKLDNHWALNNIYCCLAVLKMFRKRSNKNQNWNAIKDIRRRRQNLFTNSDYRRPK